MMKKLLSILLCLLMLVGMLAACGDVPPAEEGGNDDPSTEGDGGNGGNGGGSPATKKDKKIYGLAMYGVSEFELDEKGRLVKIWMLDERLDRGSEAMMGFVYGTDGKLSAIESNGEELAIVYDGDKASLDFPGGMMLNMTLTLSYHPNGSLKEFLTAYGEQEPTGYTFDAKGRMISMTAQSYSSSKKDDIQTEGNGVPVTPQMVTVVYTMAYEANKCTMTSTENGEPGEESAVLELNADGRPVKLTANEDDGEVEVMEWTWENDKLVKAARKYSEDGSQPLVEMQKITLTYDDKGNLIREDRESEGEPYGYVLYTYDDKGNMLTEVSYAPDGTEDSRTEYYYEDGVYAGYKESWNTHGTQEWCLYDAEDKAIKECRRSNWYDEYDNLSGWEVTETEYIYDVPEGALYDEIRYVKSTEYDAEGNVQRADEFAKVIYWSEDEWEQVDETTGESIWRDGSLSRDQYGNCRDRDTDEIYYFQKYLDVDGSMFYYTAEGVKTPVSAN